jgi:hypothetical protein
MLDMTWAKVGRIVLLAPIFFMLMLAGPEMVALLAVLGGDIAVVELLLAVWATSVSGGLTFAWRRTASAVRWVFGLILRSSRRRVDRPTARRPRRPSPRKRPPDEDHPDWAFA